MPSPKNREPVIFPYETMMDALEDMFAKVGGVDRAFRCLRKGYQEYEWRKRWEADAKERARMEEEDFTKRMGRKRS